MPCVDQNVAVITCSRAPKLVKSVVWGKILERAEYSSEMLNP